MSTYRMQKAEAKNKASGGSNAAAMKPPITRSLTGAVRGEVHAALGNETVGVRVGNWHNDS